MGATDVLGKANEMYKEIVTTSVRFDELRQSTERSMGRFEQILEQLVAKVASLHEEHVRETAQLRAEVRGLEARLSALSEQALHVVAKDAAKELMRDRLDTVERPSRKRPRRLTGGA